MKNKTITEFELLIESHLDLERQGPGSAEMTLKALSFIMNLDSNSKIAYRLRYRRSNDDTCKEYWWSYYRRRYGS